MARSLIRLPQLSGETLPASSASAFKFGKEGGAGDVLTIDTSADEVVFASSQVVKILGDLQVQGSQTILNTEVLTIEDSSIVAGLPDSKEASISLSANVVTIQCPNHGLTSAGEKFYAVSQNLPEAIYSVKAVTNADEFTVDLTAGNFAAEDGTISGRIQDTNNDFGGFMVATEGGLVGLNFRDTQNDLQLRGLDVNVDLNLSVTGNSDLDGNVTLGSQASGADDITFTGTIQGATAMKFDGATKHATNRISLAITDPSAARTITLPDASGLVPVAVADIGGGGQGAEDLGLQLSSAGLLSIDINAIGEALVSGSGVAADDLSASDEIMVSDVADGSNGAHSIKKTTIGQIQSFLAAGGTQKESFGLAAAIALNAGNAPFDYSASGANMSAGVKTAFEAASEASREIFLNGVLMREGAANDCEVDAGNDIINFKFRLEADDVVTVIARA